MVMLGALYGAADMPLTKESQMEAIRKNGKPAFVESNLNCFERGFKAASEETAKADPLCKISRGEALLPAFTRCVAGVL